MIYLITSRAAILEIRGLQVKQENRKSTKRRGKSGHFRDQVGSFQRGVIHKPHEKQSVPNLPCEMKFNQAETSPSGGWGMVAGINHKSSKKETYSLL